MSRKNDQFKAKDKKTHKMTRDGLVEVNQTTGSERRVSQRGQEFELKRQTTAGQETPTASGFAENSGHKHRQTAPPAAETPQASRLQDFAEQQQDSAAHDYSPDADIRHPDTPAPVSGQSPSQPVQASAPIRAASHTGNMQTAATVVATHSGKRHKLKQSQAAAHQETANDSFAMPQRDDTPGGPRATAHSAESTQNSASADTPPRAAERSSRLRFGESEQTPKGREPKAQQHGTRYQRKFEAEAVKQDAAVPPADDTKGHSDKLKFAADEKPPEALGDKLTDSRRRAVRPDTGDPRLDKAMRKADKTDGKLGKAREKLPTKRRAVVEQVYDEKKDKSVRKLRFEKEVKSQGAHLKGALPLRPVKAGANAVIGYGHKKMYQVEHENVGTQAAHKGEIAAEGMARSAYRFHKTRPYRRVARLERAATKRHIKLDYAKALHDNPKLKSNPLSRLMQKQKIKRQYAKAAREAKKAASRAKQAGDALSRAFGAIVGFVRRHPMLTAGVLLLILMLVAIMSMFSSCSNMAGGGFSAVFMSSYLAEDTDINDAELVYTQWETDLLLQAQNAETDRPGYDEYRYNVADVSHDPFELIAYLTAKYQSFTYAQVETDLRAIFAEQYTLTFTEEIEVRYRTEYYYDDEGELQSEEVPYNWYILNVNLTARSFSDVVAGRMTADENELFGLYMETKGNRQHTLSPFDFDWLPYVSCYFGYRIHPITGAEDYHKAVDIAVAQGTEILATHDGVVTTATWHDSYGWYVAIETTTDTGKTLVTKYAHCSTLLVSAGQTVSKGDVIAKVGSTGDSTGPHLHFEVIVDGEYLNPLFFSEGAIGGTAAPGTPGGPEYPEYPGAPMGDGTYAALMEEAQKHLGKSYVFGAKGPNTFDCSGFVCWSLTYSGVKNIQTNAQGLYNACTPVSPENAQPGDLIFFEGTYSTSNRVTHVGIYIGNGMMIHAGNPIQYTSINTSYWQSHFYSFGRI